MVRSNNNSKRNSKVTNSTTESTTAQQPNSVGVIGQAPVELAGAQPLANPLAQQPMARLPAPREYGVARQADLAHSPRKWAVLASIGACGAGCTSSQVVLAAGGLLTPTHARHYAYHAAAGGLVTLGGGGAGLFGGGGRGYTFSITPAGVDYLLAHANEPHVAQIGTYAPSLVAWVASQQQQRAVVAAHQQQCAADLAAALAAEQQPAQPAKVRAKRGRK